MASVSQRRTTRRQGSIESQRAATYRPKPRRWLKRLVLGTALLSIVVLVLPTVIAYTPLRNVPLRFALSGMHGTVQSSGASLSWFGPIRFTDIEVRDVHGEVLLAVPKVESERSLAAIISNLNDLGTFHVERHKFRWQCAQAVAISKMYLPIISSPIKNLAMRIARSNCRR